MNTNDGFIYQKYGSKKGLLKHYKSFFLTLLGYYNDYKKIDWANVQRLVFVCQGNICRSPLGAAFAHQQGIPVDSFGLNCQDNFPADSRAIAYAQSMGIDLSRHRTQHIRHYIPQETDLLIVMEPMHLLKAQKYQGLAQLTLAGLWRKPANAYIHDPFNTCMTFFDYCEGQVIKASQAVLNKMVKAES